MDGDMLSELQLQPDCGLLVACTLPMQDRLSFVITLANYNTSL